MRGKAADRPAAATSNGSRQVAAPVPDAVPAEPARPDPALTDPPLTDPALSDPPLTDPALTDPALTDPEPADRMPDDPVPAPADSDTRAPAVDAAPRTPPGGAEDVLVREGTPSQDEAPAEEASMDNRPMPDSRLDNGMAVPPAAAPPDGESPLPPPPPSGGSGIGMFAPPSRPGPPGPDVGAFGEPPALDGALAPPRVPPQAPHIGAEPGGPESGDGRLAGAPPVDQPFPQPGPPAGVQTGKVGAPRVKVKGGRKGRTPRKAHLVLSRIEPWSVMKFSFIVSLLGFIVLFVAVAALYGVLAGLGVFDALERTISQISVANSGDTASDTGSWFAASRILGYTTMIGVVNVVLITALATVGAVVYNLIADVVGGVEVTLKEAD